MFALRSLRSIICGGAVTTGPSTGFEIFVLGRQDCSLSGIPFSGAPISFVASLHFCFSLATPNSTLHRTPTAAPWLPELYSSRAVGAGECQAVSCSERDRIRRVPKTFEVHVPDELASRIEQAATARGVSVEELVQISVEEMIERDAQFESAAARVLEKNAELYRRLS